MVIKDSIKKILSLIKKGDIEKSINRLVNICKDTPYKKDVTAISFRYYNLKRKKDRGVFALDSFIVEENKIANDIIELLDDLDAYSESNPRELNYDEIIKIQLVIEGDINDFDENKKLKLQRILAEELDVVEKQIKILHVISGSIRVIIAIPDIKTKLLVNSVRLEDATFSKLFENFTILKVTVLDYLMDDQSNTGLNTAFFELDREEKYTIITLKDENLNQEIAPSMRKIFIQLINEDVDIVIVDLKNVSFISSSGLSAILNGYRLWDENGLFLLTGIRNKKLKELFSLSKVSTFLKIIPKPKTTKGYVDIIGKLYKGEQ